SEYATGLRHAPMVVSCAAMPALSPWTVPDCNRLSHSMREKLASCVLTSRRDSTYGTQDDSRPCRSVIVSILQGLRQIMDVSRESSRSLGDFPATSEQVPWA